MGEQKLEKKQNKKMKIRFIISFLRFLVQYTYFLIIHIIIIIHI